MTKLPDDLALEIAANMKPEHKATETAATETTNTETAATTQAATEGGEKAKEPTETTATADTAAKTTEEKTTTEDAAEPKETDEVDEVADEYLKTLFPDEVGKTEPAATTTTTTEAAKTEAPKADLEKQELLEKALQDPTVQWILEVKSKGLDPLAELEKIKANDPSKYKSIDLYKMQIEEMRVSEGWTDEQVEEYVEDFQSKNPIEQSNLIAAYRDKLNNEYKLTRESLKPTFNAEDAQKQYQQQQEAITNKALEDLSSWKTEAKGKDFYGLEWTQERIDRVEGYMKTTPDAVFVTNPDGTIDVPKSVRINAMELYLRDILKTAITKTKNGTLKEELTKRHNTSPDTVGRHAATSTKDSMELWLDAKNPKS